MQLVTLMGLALLGGALPTPYGSIETDAAGAFLDAELSWFSYGEIELAVGALELDDPKSVSWGALGRANLSGGTTRFGVYVSRTSLLTGLWGRLGAVGLAQQDPEAFVALGWSLFGIQASFARTRTYGLQVRLPLGTALALR